MLTTKTPQDPEHAEQAIGAPTTAAVVAAAAARLGAEHLFALMGGTNMRVVHEFADRGIPIHHFRHENGSIGGADGYFRATGRVGWSSVIHGPGFTNAITALRTAVKARSPLVLVMADTMPLPARYSPFDTGIQGLSPDALLAEIGVPVVRVSAASAAHDAVTAHQLALRNLSPVALVIPYGVETQPSGSDVEAAVRELVHTPAPVVPSDPSLDAAAQAIRDGRRIVLLAGRGASDPETARLLERLAELSGAYLSTSVRGIGAFNGSPADLGIFGGFTSNAGADVIYGADCILAFGASLNFLQTRRSSYLSGTVVVQVDDDERAFGKYDRADIPVLGDAAIVARELISRLEARPPAPARSLPTAPARGGFDDVSAPHQLDPRAVAREFDRLLPPDRTVVVDGGHFVVWPISYMRHSAPDAMLWTCDFGALGCGLGPALGAAIGRTDRPTVLFIGDCGFYMTMGDLEVAIRERIPLLVVVYNDGAAGSELMIADLEGLPADEAIFGVADLAKAAIGLGAEGAVIASLDDIEPALAAWDRQGPLLLDCRVTREVKSPLYAHT